MDAGELLVELVGEDSVNARLGGGGEQQVGAIVAGVLADLGAEVTLQPVEGERAPNVIGTFPGPGDGPTLLLTSHLDTVPWASGRRRLERSGDRLLGRGTADTKGSLAAMLVALERILDAGGLPGTLVFAGVVDEESTMCGSGALPAALPAVDAAIVGEPTSLRPIRVHNGFARIPIVVRGVAAHSSTAHLGRNAISGAARVVVALEDRLLPRLLERGHPAIGPALLTVSVIAGGTAPNVVPDRCEIVVDRRIAPGEDPAAAIAEIDEALVDLVAAGHDLVREEPFALFSAVETPATHPIVRAAERAASALHGGAVTAGGVPYSTDACQLGGRHGIPCVVLGPGAVAQAHTEEEWIDLGEVDRCVDLYARTARELCTGASA
jgi:acetylornithine deacetylase/succinyl-diaminopimelate desuccinylase-like protein